MKIISFNIRCCDDADGNSISERSARLKTVLDKYDADLIGFQEVTPRWLEQLEKDYSDTYFICNKFRAKEGSVEASTIMWKRSEFTCIDKGYFWFSSTPWIESMGNDARYNCKRICQWASLRHNKNKKNFHFFNLHFGFGDEYQIESVNLLKTTADTLNSPNILITGDFNMLPTSVAYSEITKHFSDANTLTKNYTGTTYHDYGRKDDEHIDYCFVGKGIKAKDYHLIDDTIDGKYPSDHYGILIEFEII